MPKGLRRDPEEGLSPYLGAEDVSVRLEEGGKGTPAEDTSGGGGVLTCVWAMSSALLGAGGGVWC